MLPKPEQAYFLIGDISGYTRYLSGVELDHAQDVIADLMNTVVKCLRPPFRLAKFEGDAVFVYALGQKVDGAALEDAIDAAYFAFRRRLRNIDQASTCMCDACNNMHKLDLKFVAHHGEFVKQKMAGREELAGRDVILVHRFLKNTVSERLQGAAYALYSADCVAAMGIDPVAQGLLAHHESIDIIGDVTCWVQNLEEAWQKECARTRNEVTADNAAGVIAFEIAAPRQAVWDYFTAPGKRPQWRGADEVREFVEGGRRGIGTTNHCMHGDHVIIEDIVDWRPFDYLTLTTLLPMPNAPKILMSYAFAERADGGTHIEIRIAKPKPKDAAFLEHVAPVFHKDITGEIEKLRALLEGQTPAPGGLEEPALPASKERFLS